MNLMNQSFIVNIFPVSILQLNKSLSTSHMWAHVRVCTKIMSLSDKAEMSLLKYILSVFE